ncbi:MFS transporter [Nonomuraea cavernae]|uniref:MFS transporter n=1 Tax=Nonomuraea cavernae TaxID=2045107 RepID=A0A917Z8S4_9ACTN|nr:MFS transporter [Nonomuraea cavernae]MCA2185649.1 MFS transporter [Nonomuraea cavernae]GGO78161.1 MFS transporter [Nonomuraea cavernae]
MVGTFGSHRTGEIDADKPAPFGWAPLVVLFIVGLVDRIEYNLLSGVLPLVQQEWGFSDTAAGSIPTAAALAGALVALPAGYLADRRNRTRIIATVVVIWAVATLGSGLATGFAMFYLMRVLLAAAENIDNPASGSLLADYYPPVSRAKAYGLTRVTTYLGGVGTLLGGVLGQAYGWRSAFLIMVVPGLVTAWLVWRLREPGRGELDRLVARLAPASGTATPGAPPVTPPTVPPDGHSDDAVPAAKPPFWPQIRQVLSIPTLLFVCAGLSLLTLGLAGVFYWLPSLMVRTFGVGAGAAGSLSGLITIAGTLAGTLIGSWLGRRWHGTRKGGRLLAGGGGITIGSAVLALALSMDSIAGLTVLTLLACSLMSIAIPNMMACVADVVPASGRGLGFGVLQLLITAGGAFGSLIVGIVSDRMGSLLSGMYILVPAMVIGGLLTLGARASFERDAAKVLDAARG